MWQGFTLSAWSISWLVELAQSRWSLMALSTSEEGLDLAAVLLGVGLVEEDTRKLPARSYNCRLESAMPRRCWRLPRGVHSAPGAAARWPRRGHGRL